MANTEDLKSSELKALEGSSPSSGTKLILAFSLLVSCEYSPALSPPMTNNQEFLSGETSRIGRIFNLKVMSEFLDPVKGTKEYNYAGWSHCNQDGKQYWIVSYNAPYIETLTRENLTQLAAHEVCHIHLGHTKLCPKNYEIKLEDDANNCAMEIT